ncbi:MAG: hypothetical protein M1823_000458 [Watsoniomyces obsoletus]|nr:MAG: hypothetical protein M1823_000458 [Watsoniomyces obsoletus]
MPKAARATPGPKPASSEPYPSSKPLSSTTIKPEAVTETNEPDNALKEKHNPPALKEFGHPELQPTKQEENPEENKQDPKNIKSHLDIILPTQDCSSGHKASVVPIYDNCDEIRLKIRTFLDSKPIIPGAGPMDKNGQTKPYTRNQFIKDIGVNTNSLTQFMKRSGEMSGAEMGVYPKAYIFFEKLRIFNNEPKSEARIKSEEKNGEKGLPLKDPNIHPGGLWLFCHESENPNDFLTPEQIAQGFHFPKRPFGGYGGGKGICGKAKGRGKGGAKAGRGKGGAKGVK